MHRLIKERLEEHLRSSSVQGFPSEFEAHLAICDECRDELSAFQEHASLLRALRVPETMTPAPGFYARVMDRIETQQAASVWGVFLDPAFGRRLVVGSMATLVLAAGFLWLSETGSSAPPPTADSILAVEDHPPGPVVFVLESDIILYCSKVVSYVLPAGGTSPGKNASLHLIILLS